MRGWWAATFLAALMPGAEPSWLRITGEIRERWEDPTGANFLANSSDNYLLSRLRLAAVVKVSPFFRMSAEVHDARGWGYKTPIPGTAQDTFDLRQAYAEFGGDEDSRLSFRGGRQGWRYGAGRLISDPAWGNTGQVFDGFRFRLKKGTARVDLLVGSPVKFVDRQFDRSDTAEMLYGIYTVFQPVEWKGGIDTYFLWKSKGSSKNELGRLGALDVRTVGARAFSPLSRSKGWEFEVVHQHGLASTAPIRAWAGYWMAYWQTGTARWQPRLSANYMYASGDSNPRDGRKNTFDTLYPTTHLRNGATDRLGWANIHDAHLMGDWKLNRAWRLSAGGHNFHLATVKDSLYSKSCSAILTNHAATSSHIGTELYATLEWQARTHWNAGAGYAHLFRGAYLRQSRAGSASQPYGFLGYRF